MAPNWAWYKYKTLEVCGNGEYKKFFGAAPAWDLSVDDGGAWEWRERKCAVSEGTDYL